MHNKLTQEQVNYIFTIMMNHNGNVEIYYFSSITHIGTLKLMGKIIYWDFTFWNGTYMIYITPGNIIAILYIYLVKLLKLSRFFFSWKQKCNILWWIKDGPTVCGRQTDISINITKNNETKILLIQIQSISWPHDTECIRETIYMYKHNVKPRWL